MIIVLAFLFASTEQYYKSREILGWLAAAFGGSLGLLIGRMIHVAWIDLDIVRLQGKAILAAARTSAAAKETEIADNKLKAIDSSKIRQA